MFGRAPPPGSELKPATEARVGDRPTVGAMKVIPFGSGKLASTGSPALSWPSELRSENACT